MSDPIEKYSMQELVLVRIRCNATEVGGGAVDSAIVRLQKWMKAKDIFPAQMLSCSAREFVVLFTAENAEKVDEWLTDHGANKCEESEMEES
jgi:hypothetical protein